MEKYSIEDYMVKPDEKVAKRVIYSDENTLAFVLNISPGNSLPEHTHFESTLLIEVIEGSGNINVDGEPIKVEENDLMKLGGQEVMSVDNTGDKTLVLYVTISPLPPEDRYAKNADL